MTIRTATVDDIPRVVEMGGSFIEATSYRGRIAQNAGQLADIAAKLIAANDAALFVAERGGRVVGMIGVYLFMHPYSAELFACELFWWVDPEARGAGLQLLRMAEQWAVLHGAARLQVVAPESNRELGIVYERLGFSEVETHYQKDLPCQRA